MVEGYQVGFVVDMQVNAESSSNTIDSEGEYPSQAYFFALVILDARTSAPTIPSTGRSSAGNSGIAA